ncbi:hypothetical protein LMG26411_07468 [Cupriavidus numazuensis]|uniref:Transposase n=1 Tax=Cupriavidus numazuensis TaxID=221992 RepID=A0ABN7QAC7_9BURK|nr:hypothetical protein LMG26411_07468 [Cupriavidus numazuensis]
MPFYLWTRECVASLIEREYGVTVSSTTAGRYLKAWGMSAQKPVRRAYERNDAAIARWLNEDYPRFMKEAKEEKATIHWGDEMGLRSDHVSGKSFAPMGQTPVVRATGKRFGCNMISAITNRGALAFMVFEGKFNNAVFIDFLKRMLMVWLGRISKRGDPYVRTLLVHGARAVLSHLRRKNQPGWSLRLAQRRPANVVAVAMANKMARTVWALLAHDRAYDRDYVSVKPA